MARTAIVAGSDSGIGRAAAERLAVAGFDVGITCRSDQDGAEGTAELVRGQGTGQALPRRGPDRGIPV